MKTRGFLASLCLLGVVPFASSSFASSTTAPSAETRAYSACGGHSHYYRRFATEFTVDGVATEFRASARISLSNPEAGPFLRTKVAFHFSTKNLLAAADALYRSLEDTGCSRLTYLNDASVETINDTWVVSGTLRYEQRLCTDIGSTDIGNFSRPFRIKIDPDFDIAFADGEGTITTNVKGTYEVPGFLQWNIDGGLFEFGTPEKKLPDLAVSNIETIASSVTDNGSNVFLRKEITFLGRPKGLACETKKQLGEALWSTGEFSRGY